MIKGVAAKLMALIHCALEVVAGSDSAYFCSGAEQTERHEEGSPCAMLFEDIAALGERGSGRIIKGKGNDGNRCLDRSHPPTESVG